EMDIHTATVVGFIVASSCQFHSPIAHPARIDAGFRVNRLGNSSVEYGIAIFKNGEEEASANGTFTHVFVDKSSDKSASIPANIRSALQRALRTRDQQAT
ncbi:MAG: acyl-CoA thioester hydrolase, partial [Halieaceae bacterium]